MSISSMSRHGVLMLAPKFKFYKLMQALAKKGAGVIMISSELMEVIDLSDRIAVVFIEAAW